MSRRQNNHTGVKVILVLLILALIAGSGFLIFQCIQLAGKTPNPRPGGTDAASLLTPTEPEETEAPTETTLPEPEHVVSTATVGAMGDLLMHKPLFSSQYSSICDLGGGNYDFTTIFQYLTEYSSAVDYMVANLETTLCSTDNGYQYSGYPHFNCPDQIVDGAKNAGFDMLLTVNNHSYDTGITGYKRTLEVVREKGLETLGTMLTDDEPKWTIQEVNGINIGMVGYTYATSVTSDGRPSLNGNPAIAEYGLCNYFLESNLDAFYSEVETYLDQMKQAGAEATILFIHWGVEYNTFANDTQKAMAQKLCDLGVDVIIGGHPHVIEPVALLESNLDPGHKTVCIYSLGNAVSNQRLGNISYVSTAHTEDGILFSVTFEKYSDGTVYLAGTDAIPTWVNRHADTGKLEYNILPLDYNRVDEWAQLYSIADNTLNSAKKSYDRTMAIVGDGLTECQTWLAQEKADREQYYYDLVYNPDKVVSAAADVPIADPTETTDAA